MKTNRVHPIITAVALTTLAGLPAGARQTAPAILVQPTNQSVLAGNIAAFSVSVSGTGPFAYQWQYNGTNLSNGVITTVAGNGTYGYAGDGGAATNAELYLPTGVAVDASGNLFIADQFNNVVRRVDRNGIITTVAGKGTYGYTGDGGAATNAELSLPAGLAMDASGNLFIADSGNNCIRMVDGNGIIKTVAGHGINGRSGDGGAATNAKLWGPAAIALDAAGNLFIADEINNVIRKVDTNGIISDVAGDYQDSGLYYGNGGPATNASLNSPSGVAVDASGNLFIADSDDNLIRKVGVNGIITAVAGGFFNLNNYSGDGGAATNASFNGPSGVAIDTSGNLFIADLYNSVIRKVDVNGIITTVAGNYSFNGGGYSGDGGFATDAELEAPTYAAVSASGTLFIADTGNQRIRQVVFPGPALVLNDVSGANAGAYNVVVSNPYGSVTSSVVTLTVELPPLNASIIPGQGARVQFHGVSAKSYVLLSASSLMPPVSWSPIVTNTADVNGNWSFTDTNIISSATRFYRMTTTGP